MDNNSENFHATHKKRRRWLIHYAPLVAWIVVILGLGGEIGSMNETSRFVRPLLEFLFPNALPETIDLVHGIIRKFAHLAEYAVLGYLTFRAFQTNGQNNIRTSLFAVLLVCLVAGIDEYQQSFNPARSSSPFDVLLDVAGAAAAVLILAAFTERRQQSAKSSEP